MWHSKLKVCSEAPTVLGWVLEAISMSLPWQLPGLFKGAQSCSLQSKWAVSLLSGQFLPWLWEPKQLLKYLCPFLIQATKVPQSITWDQPMPLVLSLCCYWILLRNEPSLLRKDRSNHWAHTPSTSLLWLPESAIGLACVSNIPKEPCLSKATHSWNH